MTKHDYEGEVEESQGQVATVTVTVTSGPIIPRKEVAVSISDVTTLGGKDHVAVGTFRLSPAPDLESAFAVLQRTVPWQRTKLLLRCLTRMLGTKGQQCPARKAMILKLVYCTQSSQQHTVQPRDW